MSEYKCAERAAGTTGARLTSTNKPSKPFCSLAYLAKSTVAINSSNDVRIISGHSHNAFTAPSNTPNVAATAKVNERGSPGLPTGAATAINGHHRQDIESTATAVNGQGEDKLHVQSEDSESEDKRRTRSITDVFGIINEEDANPAIDQPDGVNARRPWELGAHNGYVRRIPPALMTPANAQNGYHNGHNVLPLLSKVNSMDCWDYTIELECLNGPQDLQLAAELGKTLLERNKELETLVKELRSTVDEQQQEIVYLKKHTNALREVNDTRLKVYEQLDIGIQELERANQRLTAENSSDKKHIKTLVQNIETLEARQDDLTKQVDELRQALSVERRKNERLNNANEKRNSVAGVNETNQSGGAREEVASEELSTMNNGNRSSGEGGFEANTTAPENCSFAFRSTIRIGTDGNSTSLESSHTENSMTLSDLIGVVDDNEEIIKLVNDLEMTKKSFVAEQQRCAELEEQLVAIIQENQTLQSRLANNSPNEEIRSMQEELSILDEVRQGKMCSRCLRVIEDRGTIGDEQSSLAPTEEFHEDDEGSLLDNASECSQAAYRPGVSIKVSSRVADSLDLSIPGSPNPYRDLVEKYEALLEVQCSVIARKNIVAGGSSVGAGGGISLADEFQSSGELSQLQKVQPLSAVAGDGVAVANVSLANGIVEDGAACANLTSNNANCGSINNVVSNVKDMCGRTPTEYSEADTSSSGYAEETSNKSTQTENRPGSFLCTIGDGEVCKFSIYDDASPIESHFRNRPEYKELFKEIFAVLKKAAASKEEGEKLPLLDDTEPITAGTTIAAKVPPVTPANEELPIDFGDDTQSVISSAVSEQSFAMSECITKLERKTAKKHIIEKNQENQPPVHAGSAITTLVTSPKSPIVENGRILTPLKREPLEYLSVGVGIKKKNRRKNRNHTGDGNESPATLPSPPRFFIASGKKRRDVRPYVPSPLANAAAEQPRCSRASGGARYEWNGNSMVIYNRSLHSPSGQAAMRGRELDLNNLDYQPSFLSMELHQLKKLDMSYAEVLRSADSCKHGQSTAYHHHHHHHHHQQQHQPQHKQQKQQRNRKN